MKRSVSIILIVLTGVVLSVFVYKELKTNKSFLKMNEAEKKKFILDAEKKLWEIRNNPKLTEEEKGKAIETLNKKNEDNYTEEEKKAMSEIWVKELQAGNIKLKLSPSDLGIGVRI